MISDESGTETNPGFGIAVEKWGLGKFNKDFLHFLPQNAKK